MLEIRETLLHSVPVFSDQNPQLMIDSLGSPHPQSLSRLPSWLSRWFGYRQSPPSKLSQYEIYLWSFIGSFCGLALIQAVFEYVPYFVKRGAPPIVASYGASAVLIYGAIEAPLSQPRGLIAGHILGAFTGICITKLFHLLPEEMFQKVVWICGSLACSSSIVVMQATGTMHPPGGATALLAAISPEVRQLGWYLLPVVLLSSMLALVVALIVNNIRCHYPLYWFRLGQTDRTNEVVIDMETGAESPSESEKGHQFP